jgi:hypothetical protein
LSRIQQPDASSHGFHHHETDSPDCPAAQSDGTATEGIAGSADLPTSLGRPGCCRRSHQGGRNRSRVQTTMTGVGRAQDRTGPGLSPWLGLASSPGSRSWVGGADLKKAGTLQRCDPCGGGALPDGWTRRDGAQQHPAESEGLGSAEPGHLFVPRRRGPRTGAVLLPAASRARISRPARPLRPARMPKDAVVRSYSQVPWAAREGAHILLRA